MQAADGDFQPPQELPQWSQAGFPSFLSETNTHVTEERTNPDYAVQIKKSTEINKQERPW